MPRWRIDGGALPIGLLFLVFSAASGSASPASLATLLSVDSATSGIRVSLLFAPLGGVGESVAFEPEVALPPASVQKVVTTAAALDLLGPDHRFATELLGDRPIREGRLEGNLYLRGNGDPFLVTERLWLLAHEAAVSGLRSVTGSLVVEAASIPALEEIRRHEELDRPYAAPVSRLAVNFNTLSFLVRPAETIDGAATVWIEPFAVARVIVESQVRTVARGSPDVDATRSWRGETEIWTLTGEIPVDAPPFRVRRAASDPALLAGGTLAGLLAREGIEVGGVRAGRVPEKAVPLASLPSLPLGVLVRSMNAWSNNFMADLLLVVLGGEERRETGSTPMEEWLAAKLGEIGEAQLVDGSGLSPGNRISAAQIVRLLVWAHGEEPVFPDLYASLPRPGGEGTLERRFGDGSRPALRAKTGTLGDYGVSSIAGYIDHPTEGRYAFCILQQAAPAADQSVGDLRRREEQWLREFAEP